MKRIILTLIRFYQKVMPFRVCRFSPTCSNYTYQAIEKYGSIKGLFLGIKRIIRCHPWNKGGFDPVV